MDRLEPAIRTYSTTIYHPIGTCSLGERPSSVVDDRLRVRGIIEIFT